jgi:hypothetical protein
MYSAVSGNVGIGTTSPSFWAKLHVTTPVVTTIRLSTPSNDFSGMSGIRLDAPAHDWLIANENQLSNGLLFLDVTASQDRLFIDTDGNVGVGTTSPSEKLTVNGDIDMIKGQSRIHGTGEISFDWSAGSTYDNPSYHGVQSKDEAGSWGDEIRINSMNDIINTVDANDNDATSYYKVQHHSTGDGEDLFWVRSSDGNAYHKGNVGIGITNPTQKLDVAGTAKATDFECSGCIDAGDIDANQVQRRVSGSCSAGSSIRIINSDGTVTCETDDAGDTVASCSDVDNCSYTGSIRHFEWMSSNTTFRLYCGHGSGCTYVYYKNGSRTAGTLSNGGTVDITMTPDGSDCRFLFAKTMNGMDMLVCDVFNTNNPYMHFICHDTK